MAAGAPAGIDLEKQWAAITSHTPLGRLIEPDEIGVAVALVASDLFKSLHGVLLPVDGGIVVQPWEDMSTRARAAAPRKGRATNERLQKRALVDLISLRGHTALVTGGGQGFGFAIAERLAEVGATVGILDVDRERAAQARSRILGQDPTANIVALQADVTQRETVEAGKSDSKPKPGPSTSSSTTRSLLEPSSRQWKWTSFSGS